MSDFVPSGDDQSFSVSVWDIPSDLLRNDLRLPDGSYWIPEQQVRYEPDTGIRWADAALGAELDALSEHEKGQGR